MEIQNAECTVTSNEKTPEFQKRVNRYRCIFNIFDMTLSMIIFTLEATAIYLLLIYFVPYIVGMYATGFTFTSAVIIALILTSIRSEFALAELSTSEWILNGAIEQTKKKLDEIDHKHKEEVMAAKGYRILITATLFVFHIINLIPLFIIFLFI